MDFINKSEEEKFKSLFRLIPSYQGTIKTHYLNSNSIKSLSELLPFKNSDSIYIFGNGPGAIPFIQSFNNGYIKADTSGSSAITLARFPLTYYFFEPCSFINKNWKNNIKKLSRFTELISYHVIEHEYIIASEQIDKCKVILPNPQFHQRYLRKVSKGNIVIPRWYFIDEQTETETLYGLKTYFSYLKSKGSDEPKLLLNFKNSIIRQISLAFELGYQDIHLVGLEPSTPGYWYTQLEIIKELMSPNVFDRCTEPISNLKTASDLTSETDEPFKTFLKNGSDEYFTFNRSIILIIKLFLTQFNSKAKVTIHSSDNLISDLVDELKLLKIKRFNLI